MSRVAFALLGLLIAFTCLNSRAEGVVGESKLIDNKQHFNILIGNSKIGDFDIVKIEESERTSYFAKSNVEVRLIKQFAFVYTLNCVYEKEKLISSKFILYCNGSPTDSTSINWTGSDYIIIKNNATFHVNMPIYDSAVKLYFEEPTKTTQVFSEREGEYMSIEQSQLELFKLIAPSKKRQVDYNYKANHLKEIKVDLTVVNFKMVRE